MVWCRRMPRRRRCLCRKLLRRSHGCRGCNPARERATGFRNPEAGTACAWQLAAEADETGPAQVRSDFGSGFAARDQTPSARRVSGLAFWLPPVLAWKARGTHDASQQSDYIEVHVKMMQAARGKQTRETTCRDGEAGEALRWC